MNEEMRDLLQDGPPAAGLARYLGGCRKVSGYASQDLGSLAAALAENRLQQVDRLDRRRRAGDRLGEFEDRPNARRQNDPVPEAILAGAERLPDGGVSRGPRDLPLREVSLDRRVAFLAQRQEQMLGADVIVVVVPALLLG